MYVAGVFLLVLEQAVEVLALALQKGKKKKKISLICNWYFLIQ